MSRNFSQYNRLTIGISENTTLPGSPLGKTAQETGKPDLQQFVRNSTESFTSEQLLFCWKEQVDRAEKLVRRTRKKYAHLF